MIKVNSKINLIPLKIYYTFSLSLYLLLSPKLKQKTPFVEINFKI